MPTYLALFRGINIGGHHKLPMNELVPILNEAGCRNVRTYIQSGNIVFDTRRHNLRNLSDEIQHAIAERYGFSPSILLLTPPDLKNAIARNPFPTNNGKILSFLFLESVPENPDIDRLNALKSMTEKYFLTNKVFYLYSPDGFGRSKLAGNSEKCLGVATTGRNWNTVNRLAEMLGLSTR